jgi:hypothetical protein
MQLTTKADHKGLRLKATASDARKALSQVSDGNRRARRILQARVLPPI